MNENQNYEQPEEIIISFQKLWDNFKQYWWICAITVAVAVLGVVGLTVKEYRAVSHLSEDEMVDGENTLYQATTMVYMQPQLEHMDERIREVSDDIQNAEKSYAASVNEYVKSYIEQWNWSRNNQLMYDCMALLSSDKVQSQLNEVLKSEGMNAYDKVLDNITMEILSGSRYYRLIVRGEDEKRVELIANTATDILLKEAKSVMDINNGTLIDKAVVDLCKKQEDGSYKVITEQSELQDKQEDGTTTLSIRSFISKKKILLVFVGGFFGLGIIFIFVLMDKKLRNKNEVNMYLHIPYLGEVSKKSGEAQYAVLTTTLMKKCEQEGIKKVLFTTPKECEVQEKLANSLGVECGNTNIVKVDMTTSQVEDKIIMSSTGKELTVVSAPQLLESSDGIKAVSSVDGVVLFITANGDTIPELEEAISHIKTVGGKVLGYVLCK